MDEICVVLEVDRSLVEYVRDSSASFNRIPSTRYWVRSTEHGVL